MTAPASFVPYMRPLNLPVSFSPDISLENRPKLNWGGLRFCSELISFKDNHILMNGTIACVGDSTGKLLVSEVLSKNTSSFKKVALCALKIILCATIILPLLALIGAKVFNVKNPMVIKVGGESHEKAPGALTVGGKSIQTSENEDDPDGKAAKARAAERALIESRLPPANAPNPIRAAAVNTGLAVLNLGQQIASMASSAASSATQSMPTREEASNFASQVVNGVSNGVSAVLNLWPAPAPADASQPPAPAQIPAVTIVSDSNSNPNPEAPMSVQPAPVVLSTPSDASNSVAAAPANPASVQPAPVVLSIPSDASNSVAAAPANPALV